MPDVTTGSFSIVLAGDAMLGRLIDQLRHTHHVHSPADQAHVQSMVQRMPRLRDYGALSPWGDTIDVWRSADLRLVNLETALTNEETPWPDKAFNFRSHPANVDFLTSIGIDFVSVANNHSLDFGIAGLDETLRTLESAGIVYAGAGWSPDEALRGAVLQLGKRKVYVYAASDHPDDWRSISRLSYCDYSADFRALVKARITSESADADLRIFSLHAGPNYAWQPHRDIRDLAHFLIDDCGVDLVYNHSSHHVSGVEIWHGKVILYGLGPAVDDYAVTEDFRSNLGALWRLSLMEKGDLLHLHRLDILPTRVETCQTHLLDESDGDHEWMKSKLGELSRRLGTDLHDLSIELDRE